MPGCVNSKFKSNAPDQAFVIAGEPRAAAIGRDLMAQGGSAADAAAGMALAMTATLPSRVGLAGGGVCVVFDAAAKRVRTLDFLPRAAGPAGSGFNGAAAPGLLRAIYAMHATSGSTLRWEQIAVQAEVLARENPGISRALAQDLQAGASRLSDPEARRIFLPAGRAPAEGAALSQPELASVLSLVRRNGLNAFYTGSTAQALAASLGVDAGSLRTLQPQWRDTVAVRLDSTKALHFADLPEPESGAALAKAWAAAEKAPAAERAARAAQALGAMTGNEAPGAGLVAIDQRENAVACAFTMGGLFGTGRVAPGTGVLGATGVDRAGFGAPALVANTIVGRALFGAVGTASGSDGPAAGPVALLTAAVPALLDDRSAPAALAAHGDAPGRVDLVNCQVSLENGLKDCRTAADPRGLGFAYDLLLARE
ncbi:gamma-glutamyltransferase [Azospirillum sp. sgz301742]